MPLNEICTYVPKPEVLAHRVIAYFQANPTMQLETRQVAAKFNVEAGCVMACLKPAVDHQVLAADMPAGMRCRIYSAGPRLMDCRLHPVGAPASPAAAAAAQALAALSPPAKPAPAPSMKALGTTPAPTAAQPFPPSAPATPPAPLSQARHAQRASGRITIEPAIPMPEKRRKVSLTDELRPQLQAMTVGDSFAIPLTQRHQFFTAIGRNAKALGFNFKSGACPKQPTQWRIWRVA